MYQRKTKTCRKCGKRRALEQFTLYKGSEIRAESLVPRCRQCRAAYLREYTAKRKARTFNANAMLAYAVRSGKIKREPCQMCAKYGKPAYSHIYFNVHAHHSDYRKPFEVMWLCYLHHKAWHRVFKTEERGE